MEGKLVLNPDLARAESWALVKSAVEAEQLWNWLERLAATKREEREEGRRGDEGGEEERARVYIIAWLYDFKCPLPC